MFQLRFWAAAWIGAAALCGCQENSGSDAPAASAQGEQTLHPLAGDYLLPASPAGAEDVAAVREQAGDGDQVVVVGRIGGSANPWVDGKAAFSIVDLSLKACSDIPGDACERPWDYCCETARLPDSTALIQVVDGQGALLDVDARQLLGVQELARVVVQGAASRDENGNLTVLANGVHVARP